MPTRVETTEAGQNTLTATAKTYKAAQAAIQYFFIRHSPQGFFTILPQLPQKGKQNPLRTIVIARLACKPWQSIQ
jgi:hypothetical protein